MIQHYQAAEKLDHDDKRKERHLVEAFFLKLKELRRVATRYDKLADRFLSFVHLACIRILLA